MSWKSGAKSFLLDLAYKGEVAFSRMQGIAFDRPPRNGEYALIRQLRGHIRLAFDVGANAGDWTAEVLSQTGGKCEVACVEADAKNAEFVRKRFATAGNVHIFNVAASDSEGTAFFQSGVGELSGVGHLASAAGSGTVEVVTTTLEKLAEKYPGRELDLVKVDIEGAEMSMLAGAKSLFAGKRIGVMQLEYNATWLAFGTQMRDLFAFAREHGYEVLNETPFGFMRVPRYGIGLEDYRLRNLLLVRPDRVASLDPFGPCGRAKVEAGRVDAL